MNFDILKTIILDYTEEIKEYYFDRFISVDDKVDYEAFEWMKHIYKIMDGLIIEETFENFMDVNEVDLMKQFYFNNLDQYAKKDLLKIITNKHTYIRN